MGFSALRQHHKDLLKHVHATDVAKYINVLKLLINRYYIQILYLKKWSERRVMYAILSAQFLLL